MKDKAVLLADDEEPILTSLNGCGIIEDHGGRIEVDSEVGRGTTFSIYLPAVGNPSQMAEIQPNPEEELIG